MEAGWHSVNFEDDVHAKTRRRAVRRVEESCGHYDGSVTRDARSRSRNSDREVPTQPRPQLAQVQSFLGQKTAKSYVYYEVVIEVVVAVRAKATWLYCICATKYSKKVRALSRSSS